MKEDKTMTKKIIYVIGIGMLLILLAACGSSSPATPEVARPSVPGGTGEAVNLTGDPVSGKAIFVTNCVVCHGEEGKGGVENPGSVDGTVPSLNPAASDLWNPDYQTFAYNADLFIEHGSTPAYNDSNNLPQKSMIAWGDSGTLKPQDIADVIAYIYSLNK